MWDGHVQKRFELKPGNDYLIRVQSATKFAADSDKTYNFSVGLPHFETRTISLNSTNTYSIPANTSKTFRFNVSGYPNSARLLRNATISFTPSSNRYSITSLKIIAPNGKVLTGAQFGEYNHNQDVNFNNYLTSLDNINLNGIWTVTVKADAAISGLKFRISSNIYYIPGSDGNE